MHIQIHHVPACVLMYQCRPHVRMVCTSRKACKFENKAQKITRMPAIMPFAVRLIAQVTSRDLHPRPANPTKNSESQPHRTMTTTSSGTYYICSLTTTTVCGSDSDKPSQLRRTALGRHLSRVVSLPMSILSACQCTQSATGP